MIKKIKYSTSIYNIKHFLKILKHYIVKQIFENPKIFNYLLKKTSQLFTRLTFL